MRKVTGVPSLAAIIVNDAISDALYAPIGSAAYRSANKFVNGGECSHVVCSDCVRDDDWRTGECPPGGDGIVPCGCHHSWTRHIVMFFDWTEHRDVLAGAAGIEPGALRGAACISVRTVGEASSPTSTPITSKSASTES